MIQWQYDPRRRGPPRGMLPISGLRRPAELLQAGSQQGLAVRISVEAQVASPEDPKQRVVETADSTWRIPVPHSSVDRGAVDGGEQSGELVERGDAELEQQAGNPDVVVGAGPTCVGVLTGEERGEILGADPRVADVGLSALVGDRGL